MTETTPGFVVGIIKIEDSDYAIARLRYVNPVLSSLLPKKQEQTVIRHQYAKARADTNLMVELCVSATAVHDDWLRWGLPLDGGSAGINDATFRISPSSDLDKVRPVIIEKSKVSVLKQHITTINEILKQQFKPRKGETGTEGLSEEICS